MSRATSPMGKLDAQGRVDPYSFNNVAFQGEYTGTNLIYKGEARSGASTSAAAWQIAKLTYDGSDNVTSITWPQNSFGVATTAYEFVWDNRASYTYS